MSQASTHINLPLHALLARLRAEGFEVGTSTVLDLQKVIANVQQEDVSQLHELRYLFSPIICRNKEEQERFYRIYEEYLASLGEQSIELPKQPEKGVFWKKPGRWLVVPTTVLLLVFLFKTLVKPKPQPVTFGIVDKSERKVSLKGDTLKLGVDYADTVASKNYKTNWQVYGPGLTYTSDDKQQISTVADSAGNYNFTASTYNQQGELIATDSALIEVLCELPPSVAILGGATDSSSGEFTAVIDGGKFDTAYHFHWLVNDQPVDGDTLMETSLLQPGKPNTVSVKVDWPNKRLHCSVDSLYQQLDIQPPFQLTVAPTPNSPLQLNKNYNYGNILWGITGLLVLPLISAGLFWWRFRKRPEKTEEPADEKPKEYQGPFVIEFKNHQDKILPETGISQLAEVLRKRHTSDILQLSINKTIKSTIRKGGFPVLEYTPRTQPTDFLILVDKEFPEGHLTHLFSYVVERLKKEQVHLTVYTFSREPLLLSNEALNHVLLPIDKVARLYPETMLIIFSKAEGFFKSYEVTLKNWVTDKFKGWNTKLLLTPLAKKDWGARELALYQAGFTVVPADMNAYGLIYNEINQMIDKQALREEIVPETYSSNQYNFNRYRQVSSYLKNALQQNNSQFGHTSDNALVEQWLCALAVYPHINWQVTVAIGKAFEDVFSSPGRLLNYSNLLVLSRIQWMNDGQLMDSLKIEMLNKLEPEKEALARKVIVNLMSEIADTIQPDSLIKNEWDAVNATNKVLLNAHDSKGQELTAEEWQQFKSYVDNDQLDWGLQTYLQQGENTLLTDPANSSRTLPLSAYVNQKDKQKLADDEGQKTKPKRSMQELLKAAAPLLSFIIVLVAAYLLLKANDRLQFVDQRRVANILFNADTAGSAKGIEVQSISMLMGSTLLQGQPNGNNSFIVSNVPVSDSLNQAVVQVALNTGNLESTVLLNSSSYTFNIQPKIVADDTALNQPGVIDLPDEVNEIWSLSETNGNPVGTFAFYLKAKLLFTRDNGTPPTEQAELLEGGPAINGAYKAIFKTAGKYEVAFFYNVKEGSMQMAFCLKGSSFDSLSDARKVRKPACTGMVNFTPLYQPVADNASNANSLTVQFPQNKTNLVAGQDKKFQAAYKRYLTLSQSDRKNVTVSISLNGFYKFTADVQQRQAAIRNSPLGKAFNAAHWQFKPFSGDAFQRDYVTIDFGGQTTPDQPNCNRVFSSMKEALSVKPATVCKLDLSNQYLYNLPKEIYTFINLQQLNISGNSIGDAEIKTFMSRFPKCQLINNAGASQSPQQQTVPTASPLDGVLKAAKGEVGKP